jgi:hypothetical protein
MKSQPRWEEPDTTMAPGVLDWAGIPVPNSHYGQQARLTKGLIFSLSTFQ